MDIERALINDHVVHDKTKSCNIGRTKQCISITVLCGLIAWLAVITWYLVHQSTLQSHDAVTAATVSLPLSNNACLNTDSIKAGTPVSFDAVDGGIVPGAGTSVYIGAQHHDYGSYTPNHLNVVSLDDDHVLLGLGSFVVVGEAGKDWVTGGQYPFNVSADAAPLPGWGRFYELPLFVDEIVLLSSINDTALLVAVGGGGVMGLRVDLTLKSVVIGDHFKFVTGPSIDTDTAAIGPSTFAISYYRDAADGSIQLMTIAGSVSNTLNVTFGAAVQYSPNHMFHQILSLGPNLYALAFPHDNMSGDSSASPMGILIASVGSANSITIFSADGKGAPWLQTYVLGYYFFDMILVDRAFEVDGLTATGAMAVVDRSAADAITVVTFRVSAAGNGASGYTDVNCVFGSQLTVTQPGATIGYNYFAMQPLFTLTASTNMNNAGFQQRFGGFRGATLKNDFAIAWQDTAKNGAVDAVVVGYALETGRLGVVMESTEISPPVPNHDPAHWWIAGGALPSGRMMILTTLDSTGNITAVEHLGPVVGVMSTSVDCASSVVSTSVVVNGHLQWDGDLPKSALLGPSLWSTTRGKLVAGQVTSSSAEQGTLDIVLGGDSCVGLVESGHNGIWFAPDMC